MLISFSCLGFWRHLATLRKIGRVIHISPGKKAVIRTTRPLKIGEKVFDGNKKVIGRVSDVFGPIKSPYIEVNIENGEPSDFVGKILYHVSSKQNKRGKRRR